MRPVAGAVPRHGTSGKERSRNENFPMANSKRQISKWPRKPSATSPFFYGLVRTGDPKDGACATRLFARSRVTENEKQALPFVIGALQQRGAFLQGQPTHS